MSILGGIGIALAGAVVGFVFAVGVGVLLLVGTAWGIWK